MIIPQLGDVILMGYGWCTVAKWLSTVIIPNDGINQPTVSFDICSNTQARSLQSDVIDQSTPHRPRMTSLFGRVPVARSVAIRGNTTSKSFVV